MTELQHFDAVAYRQRLANKLNNNSNNVKHLLYKLRDITIDNEVKENVKHDSNKQNHNHNDIVIKQYKTQLHELQQHNQQLNNTNSVLNKQIEQLQIQVNALKQQQINNNDSTDMQQTQQFTLHHALSPSKTSLKDNNETNNVDTTIQLIINIVANSNSTEQHVDQTSMIYDTTDTDKLTNQISLLQLQNNTNNSNIQQYENTIKDLQNQLNTFNEKYQLLLQLQPSISNTIDNILQDDSNSDDTDNTQANIDSIVEHSTVATNDVSVSDQSNVSTATTTATATALQTPARSDNRQSLLPSLLTPSNSNQQAIPATTMLLSPALFSNNNKLLSTTAVSLAATLISPVATHNSLKSANNADNKDLNNSATKIQSVYRGHLTRSAIEVEKQLRSLPIYSPATPAQRISKRYKITQSSKKNNNINELINSELLSNNIDTSDVTIISNNNDKTTDITAITTSTFMPPSTPTNASISSVITTNTVATIATATTAITTKPKLTLRQVRDDIKQCKKVIKDLNNDWTLRSNALNKLDDICRNLCVTDNDDDKELWIDILRDLHKPVADNIIDLRSSIVREVCRTLVALVQVYPIGFEQSLVYYLPILFKNLFVTIKAISQSTDECIHTLLTYCHTYKIIPVLATGCSDTHREVRQACGQYLAQLLIQHHTIYSQSSDTYCSQQSQIFEQQLDIICDLVSKHISDADKDVRSSMRHVFESLYISHRQRADAMFDSFSAAIQKTIESERRTNNNNKTKAGKRKKNISTSSNI